MSKSSKQFRPYLTAEELDHIMELLTLSHENPISFKLLNKLAVFKFKIQNELIRPASTVTPKLSPLEKLGGVSPEEQRYLSGEMNEAEEQKYLEQLMGGGDSESI